MPMIEIDDFPAYRAEAVGELRGGLILIHEVWGLVPHIKDVADRFAAEGYLVIAPDLLSGIGLSPEVGTEISRLMSSADEEERSKAQPLMREMTAPSRSPEYGAWAVAALKHAVDYLEAQHDVDGRIGVVGFCFGGTYAFALAAADPRIRAAVPYYGQPPETAHLPSIECPVLALYGGTDERLMLTFPEVNKAMHDAGVQFVSHIYPEAGHAFFNDSNSRTYNADAAADAWIRTLEFLRGTLAPTPEYVTE
ncbi:MAG: dienelactone hydrolase family protein [Glaciihabitans sp.]|nr:dienelactone hydrolase family protein [Glaciihabitans sp.]MDQ1570338.1 carboxymethylenebutenolidase [Actinomycetota bacterium]